MVENMTKSELIEALAGKNGHLNYKDVELAVKSLLEQMSWALATGQRIEIRGFGSFSLHYRPPRNKNGKRNGNRNRNGNSSRDSCNTAVACILCLSGRLLCRSADRCSSHLI